MLDSFVKLLSGEQPDRVVWTADITYWIAGQKQAGTANPAWDSEEGYLQLHRDLGVMPYYYYDKFWVGEPRYTSAVQTTVERDGPRTITRMATPLGELTQELLYLPQSCSTGTVKHFVQSEADLKLLHYVLQQRRLAPACLVDYQQRLQLWRQYGGLPSLALPRSPLSALMYEWMGVENAIYALADYPDAVCAVLDLMREQETPVLDAVCAAAPPLIHFADNLSSDTMVGLYDTYLAGDHRRRIGRLHQAGTRCAVHLDGVVGGLLPKLVHAGFDAVEALTPQPAGDLSVEEIDNIAGSRRVIQPWRRYLACYV